MSDLGELRHLIAPKADAGLALGRVERVLDSMRVLVRLDSGVLRNVKCPQGTPGVGERVMVRGTSLVNRVSDFAHKTVTIL